MALAKLQILHLWIHLLLASTSVTVGIVSDEICDRTVAPWGADSEPVGNLTRLYFLVMLPFPDPHASPQFQPSLTDGPDILPAAQLAAEHINNSSEILRNYSVQLIVGDGGCDVHTKAAVTFVRDGLSSDKKIAGLIGPGCSGSTLTVTPMTSRSEIALVNVHIAGSPVLSNYHDKYPYAFGVLASSFAYASSVLALMQQNRWEKIAVLYEDSRPFFTDTVAMVENEVRNALTEPIPFLSPVFKTYLPLDDIIATPTRIIVVLAGPQLSGMLICLAYHKMMFFPAYQWVFMNRVLSDFDAVEFGYEGKQYSCSKETVRNMTLNRAVLLHYKLTPTDNNTQRSILDIHVSHEQYWLQYQQRVQEINTNCRENITASVWGAPIYDAVWSLALALNKSIPQLKHFDHRNKMTEVIASNMYELEFEGVSGKISFDPQTGFNLFRGIEILQIFDGKVESVGFYSVNSSGMNDENPHAEFIKSTFELRRLTVHPAIVAVSLLITSVILIGTVVAHVLTLFYHNLLSVKASSPKLGHVMYVGCYILITALVAYQLLKVFPAERIVFNVSCNVFNWCLHISYTLILTTVGVRTWRIYRIFNHFRNPGKLLSDHALLTFILLLSLVDVTILAIWSGVDPLMMRENRHLKLDEVPPVIEVEAICDSEYFPMWFGFIFGWHFVITLGVICVALSTRRIHHQLKQFNTRKIAVLAYAAVFILGLGVPAYVITLFVEIDITVNYVILSVVANSILVLCLIFLHIPPLFPVLQDKYHKSMVTMHSYV